MRRTAEGHGDWRTGSKKDGGGSSKPVPGAVTSCDLACHTKDVGKQFKGFHGTL